MFLPYKRTFDYKGTSSQKEFNLFFWTHLLLCLVFSPVFFISWDIITEINDEGRFASMGIIIRIFTGCIISWFAWIFLVMLSLFTRRLRDAGRTLWWLLCFLPIPGAILILILVCTISETNTKSVEYSQNQRNIS